VICSADGLDRGVLAGTVPVVQRATYDHQWDPGRRTISIADPRLNRFLVRQPERCATVNEYAQSSGLDTGEVIELLGPYLDDGTLALEFVADEVFVHTAPAGRPAPPGHADVPSNLWERLRIRSSLEMSYAVWKLIRSMERAGWQVETNPSKVLFGLGPVSRVPYFGVVVAHQVVPVLPFPSPDELVGGSGLLTEYERAGAPAVAVICDEGALDENTTSVRRWVLSQRYTPPLSVLVLEAPRYNPVLLAPADGAVRPVAITRETPLV
jgi:hypothetical protein